MTIDEGMLIAAQALELANVKDELDDYKEVVAEAYAKFVCIGGPLNDNRLEFNHRQRAYLQRIADGLQFREFNRSL